MHLNLFYVCLHIFRAGNSPFAPPPRALVPKKVVLSLVKESKAAASENCFGGCGKTGDFSER